MATWVYKTLTWSTVISILVPRHTFRVPGNEAMSSDPADQLLSCHVGVFECFTFKVCESVWYSILQWVAATMIESALHWPIIIIGSKIIRYDIYRYTAMYAQRIVVHFLGYLSYYFVWVSIVTWNAIEGEHTEFNIPFMQPWKFHILPSPSINEAAKEENN